MFLSIIKKAVSTLPLVVSSSAGRITQVPVDFSQTSPDQQSESDSHTGVVAAQITPARTRAAPANSRIEMPAFCSG